MAVDTEIFPPRYRGAQLIARGGMGEIYRATDSTLGRAVAIKILSGQRNTVTIYDVGEHAGRPYIVMEYLSGGSLENTLREQGAQPAQRAFRWLEQAGAALHAGMSAPRSRVRITSGRSPMASATRR